MDNNEQEISEAEVLAEFDRLFEANLAKEVDAVFEKILIGNNSELGGIFSCPT